MKSFITPMFVAAAMAGLAAPAFAHDPVGQNSAQRQYSQYFGGYQTFDELYQHDVDMIRHSQRDGAFTRREAREYMAELRQIQQRENGYRAQDGFLDNREGRDIQRRLERLHAKMHDAHADGHEDQEDGWRYGQGNNGYYPQPSRR